MRTFHNALRVCLHVRKCLQFVFCTIYEAARLPLYDIACNSTLFWEELKCSYGKATEVNKIELYLHSHI